MYTCRRNIQSSSGRSSGLEEKYVSTCSYARGQSRRSAVFRNRPIGSSCSNLPSLPIVGSGTSCMRWLAGRVFRAALMRIVVTLILRTTRLSGSQTTAANLSCEPISLDACTWPWASVCNDEPQLPSPRHISIYRRWSRWLDVRLVSATRNAWPNTCIADGSPPQQTHPAP